LFYRSSSPTSINGHVSLRSRFLIGKSEDQNKEPRRKGENPRKKKRTKSPFFGPRGKDLRRTPLLVPIFILLFPKNFGFYLPDPFESELDKGIYR
jgi:hypothetical protein